MGRSVSKSIPWKAVLLKALTAGLCQVTQPYDTISQRVALPTLTKVSQSPSLLLNPPPPPPDLPTSCHHDLLRQM